SKKAVISRRQWPWHSRPGYSSLDPPHHGRVQEGRAAYDIGTILSRDCITAPILLQGSLDWPSGVASHKPSPLLTKRLRYVGFATREFTFEPDTGLALRGGV